MKKIRTHYDNLQVIETASPEVIRGAYRHLSQKWHPDKNPNKQEEAARIMRMVNEAYAVLSDPVQRQKYDARIKEQRAKQEDTVNSQSESTAKEQAKSSNADPYEIVGDELLNGVYQKGLWVKALVDAKGDENKQKALYIKYRVQQLKGEKGVFQNILDKIPILDKIKKVRNERREERQKQDAFWNEEERKKRLWEAKVKNYKKEREREKLRKQKEKEKLRKQKENT